MNCSRIKYALVASIALGVGALHAQEMGTADEQPTVTEQLDPDKGQEIVNEAEEKRSEINAEQAEIAQADDFVSAYDSVKKILKEQLKLREGYNRKNKSLVVVSESSVVIEDPADPKTEFMNIRTMKALDAYLSAKAKIVRSINTDITGADRIATLNEFGQDDVMKVFAEKKSALEAKKIELAKALVVLDAREADALAGVTISDRFCAILDGIAKKLDSSYNKHEIEAEKKAAYEEIKERVAVLKDEYMALVAQFENLPKYPKNEIQSDVAMLSKQPILGAYTLVQSESWDKTDKTYQVAMAVVWSPRLEANAVKIAQGDMTPAAKKGLLSVEDWIDQQNLSCMIGSRRITDDEGHTIFVGIGAEDISGPVVDRKARKALADSDAIQAVARALYSDLEVFENSKRVLKEYGDGAIASKSSISQVIQSKYDLNLKGCSQISSVECVHPISNRKTYVSVYYIDPTFNRDAVELLKSAYTSAGLAVAATQYTRGVHAGEQAALEDVRKSPEAFNKGYKEGKKAVKDEIEKKKAIPLKKAQSAGAAASKKKDPAKGNGGTFSGDANIDTDF